MHIRQIPDTWDVLPMLKVNKQTDKNHRNGIFQMSNFGAVFSQETFRGMQGGRGSWRNVPKTECYCTRKRAKIKMLLHYLT